MSFDAHLHAAQPSTKALSLDGSPQPFAFEVGDARVLRGLNDAIVLMTEVAFLSISNEEEDTWHMTEVAFLSISI